MTLKRLIVGAKLTSYPGRTHNAICDFVDRGWPAIEQVGSESGATVPLMIRNSWKDLHLGDIIGLGRPLRDPSNTLKSNEIKVLPPVLEGVAIDAEEHIRSHGILLSKSTKYDPMVDGSGVGWVAVYGVHWARLNIGDMSHKGIKLVDNQEYYSTQPSQGDIWLHWKPNLTGNQFGLVQLPAAGDLGFASGKMDADINVSEVGQMTVWKPDGSAAQTPTKHLDVFLHPIAGSGPDAKVSLGKWVFVIKEGGLPTPATHKIFGAECEDSSGLFRTFFGVPGL